VPGDAPPPFRDAEAWLAERGIEREPLRIPPAPPPDEPAEPVDDPATGHRRDVSIPEASTEPAAATMPSSSVAPGAAGPAADITPRDITRLAEQAAADAALREGDAAATPDPTGRHLEDDVAAAVAFVRRSTAGAPQSEGRLRSKLAERGVPSVVVEQALVRARRERLVDDPALAAALVDERRRRGHASSRIRSDLRDRGFDDATIAAALADTEGEDPEAAAFAVAQERAARLTGLSAESAFRRVVGYLARRGYPEGLSRKVAREAVFASRDPERAAGH
jgi:regulatory protein